MWAVQLAWRAADLCCVSLKPAVVSLAELRFQFLLQIQVNWTVWSRMMILPVVTLCTVVPACVHMTCLAEAYLQALSGLAGILSL